MYVLGGDSYTNNDFSSFNYIPGLTDLVFENGFKNDGMAALMYCLYCVIVVNC